MHEMALEAKGAMIAFLNPLPIDQSTKHARKLFIANLPPGVTEDAALAEFFNVLLSHLLPHRQTGKPVVGAFLNAARCFAFLELRSIEETTFCLDLDGVSMAGYALKIRRPQDYNAELAHQQLAIEMRLKGGISSLRGAKTVRNLNSTNCYVSSSGLENITDVDTTVPLAIGAKRNLCRLFVGGLPPDCQEASLSDLFSQFDKVKVIEFMQNERGKCAFVEIRNQHKVNYICEKLHGFQFCGKPLTVRKLVATSHSNYDELFDCADNSPSLELVQLQTLDNPLPKLEGELPGYSDDLQLPALAQLAHDPELHGVRFVCVRFDAPQIRTSGTALSEVLAQLASRVGILLNCYPSNDRSLLLEFTTPIAAHFFAALYRHLVAETPAALDTAVANSSARIELPPQRVSCKAAKTFCKVLLCRARFSHEALTALTKFQDGLEAARYKEVSTALLF